MTIASRWRTRRDRIIRLVYSTGCFSQRILADVFDMPQSRVSKIINAEVIVSEVEWRKRLQPVLAGRVRKKVSPPTSKVERHPVFQGRDPD